MFVKTAYLTNVCAKALQNAVFVKEFMQGTSLIILKGHTILDSKLHLHLIFIFVHELF